MIHLGLTGYPLSHSLSPTLHKAALSAIGLQGEYRLYPVAPGDMDSLADLARRIRNGKIDGLNVTIPHKQIIISLLDELTPSAEAIGAVNTLYMRDGRLIGHNTDAPGFLADVKEFLRNTGIQKNALVLGAGGAARAVAYALLQDGWKLNMAVRQTDFNQAQALKESFGAQAGSGGIKVVLLETENLGRLGGGVNLIVNATPIGMFPETDYSAWPEGLPFPEGCAVYDLVYNPPETRLVREARAAGRRATTGLGMLVEQAGRSFTCWTGREVARGVLFDAVEEV